MKAEKENTIVNLAELMTDNRELGVPKYVQLRDAVLSAIAKGSIKPGEQLPPDLDIVRDTGLSLGTVQSAMRALLKERAIVRSHGRGTFVAEESITQLENPWYCCFSKDGHEGEFLPVYIKLLSCTRVTGKKPPVSLLNFETDDFIQIDRLITIAKEFSFYDRFFLDASKYEGFLSKSKEELERTNFKIILLQEYNVTIKRVARSLRVTKFPDVICKKIRLKPNTIGLIIQTIGYSQKGNPAFWTTSYIPPNELVFKIQDQAGIPAEWG